MGMRSICVTSIVGGKIVVLIGNGVKWG